MGQIWWYFRKFKVYFWIIGIDLLIFAWLSAQYFSGFLL